MLNPLPHYWINRAQDTDRRRTMENRLQRSGAIHKRVEAITPKSMPAIRLANASGTGNRPGELATMCSHLQAIHQAWRADHPFALVLEDDIYAPYVYSAAMLIKSAPADWEILQLHVINPQAVRTLAWAFCKHGVLWQEWARHHWSAGAYLINRRGMRRLLRRHWRGDAPKLSPQGAHIDLRDVILVQGVVCDYVLFRRVPVYSSTIPLFFHDLNQSSINNPAHREIHQQALKVMNNVLLRIRKMARAAGQAPGRDYPFAMKTLLEEA